MSPLCLGHAWVFENLQPEELVAMIRIAVQKLYSPGEAIFVQADPTDRMFFIKAGRVRLSKLLEDGTELMLDIRKAGDLLGENMLGEEAIYPMTASCMEQTLTCGFTKEKFEKLVLEHPRIGLQVMKNMSKRISSLTNFIEGPSSALVRMTPDTMMLVLFLGIFGGAIGYFLWTFALARLSPTQVAVYVNVNPMIATILGATLLAEKLTGVFVTGFAAVLAGVLLVNIPGGIRIERPATDSRE